MRKWLLLTLGLLFCHVPLASAFVLLNDYSGPLEFKFTDFSNGKLYTSSSNGYGQSDGQEDAFGIFKIATIKSPATQTLWFDGKDGEELTGIYHGIDDDFWKVTPSPTGNNINIQSVGGFIDVYLDKAQNFDPTQGPGARTGPASYPTVTDGDPFLRLKLVPGIKYGNGSTLDDHITFDENLDSTTSPFTGDGAFYLDVIGGSHASLFDSNSFCVTDDSGNTVCRDLFGQFDTESPGSYGWLANSEDPIRGKTNAIPEPGSIMLLGSGLLGLLKFRRREAV